MNNLDWRAVQDAVEAWMDRWVESDDGSVPEVRALTPDLWTVPIEKLDAELRARGYAIEKLP